MRRALVIGSEGNIGKPLCEYLKLTGYEVLASDIKPGWRENFVMADITNPSDLIPAFEWGPDVVFLLGAMVSRVTCEQASSLAVNTNLSGVQNVLDLSKKYAVKLVYFSTSEVYGPDMVVMDEESSPKPNNRYGLTKLLSESLVRYENEKYGLKAVILRPFMIYDENETFGDHRSAMIRFAYNLALNKPVIVHTRSERGWMHISDAVRCIEAAADLDSFEIINIGSPDIFPVADLAEMIRNEMNADKTLIHYEKIPKQMTLIKNPVLSKQEKLLGIVPEVDIAEGVKLVCQKVKERLAFEGMLNGQLNSPEISEWKYYKKNVDIK
ncbi:MAG: NAD(P)-dependent oxidoreductase [Candidatus Aminicenantes bacterium]|nr:NAD(P)-dependent oxidoreductase [Candidatus Aminicenantes bacterium]MCK5003549.1 NAD(P)-dependent oxidoreductase [Candidatus Aminicenantes bacterium]